ncbi:hypothetical protein AKJ39_01855 [candidate division MSBL1 archaeon SCGC-AAA259J03]|uniref:Uncharacterized protein n=1 Tax=candidate division MSBL1 archaeon SCGC-AAA259J03 TaxID=1698269 RepID=A0A656YX99_9EURY|nr:hypothetical protein AKJ39_01855 [candidate division MSBL1 archaeon SCGC-AAA259J03]
MDSRKIVVVAVLGVLGLGLFSTFSARSSATATLSAGADATGFVDNIIYPYSDDLNNDRAGNLKYGQEVTWDAIDDTATGIDNGDLYLINLTDSDYAGELLVTLYMTNPDDVAAKYSYWNAQIDAYTLENTWDNLDNKDRLGDWSSDDENIMLSLSQGYVTWRVGRDSEDHLVDIVIEDGSCYTTDSTKTDSKYDPSFYITVQQA